MIVESSMPLKVDEEDFAVDSSGFSTCKFERWFDHKYGQERLRHDWVKVHLMCSVKTNIVTAVEIIGKRTGDAPVLPPLVETTAKGFRMHQVSADKAYGSVKNVQAITKAGATPFIALKSNATGYGGPGFSTAYREMFHYFQYRRDQFLEHYHKRSNVEFPFSMIKRKFGDSLRSKTDVAMVNEALAKILCHNIVVLVHEVFELGIDPTFRWAEKTVAQRDGLN
jgi:transposase